jgi:predicted alpha/beta hydrolase
VSAEPRRIDLSRSGPPSLPAWFHEAERAEATIILMAALGVSAKFYRSLAESLQSAGFHVLLLEQRGHGESPVRPSRRASWGFREPLVGEIHAAIAWVREHDGALPLYLMGHSLGGHYASMSVGLDPDGIDGVILVGCSSPWIGGFEGATRARIKLLHAIIPVTTRALGYFPGDRIGFGGREAGGLMRDWLAYSKTNRYAAAGLSRDLEAGIARYGGPLLSIRLSDDDYAPERGVDAVVRKYADAVVTSRVLGERDLGDVADHFRWARTPGAVVRTVVAWHAKNRETRVTA